MLVSFFLSQGLGSYIDFGHYNLDDIASGGPFEIENFGRTEPIFFIYSTQLEGQNSDIVQISATFELSV